MWLLDANMPVGIVQVLHELGIQAHTTESRGWKALTNGQLVEVAVKRGFTMVLTRDRLFSESAARALKRFPDFCVVLVRLPQLRGPEFEQAFRAAWSGCPIQAAPGQRFIWPPENP